MSGSRTQQMVVGRHHAIAAFDDTLDGWLGFRTAVEPDVIGQTGSAEELITATVRAVTGAAERDVLRRGSA